MKLCRDAVRHSSIISAGTELDLKLGIYDNKQERLHMRLVHLRFVHFLADTRPSGNLTGISQNIPDHLSMAILVAEVVGWE